MNFFYNTVDDVSKLIKTLEDILKFIQTMTNITFIFNSKVGRKLEELLY